MTIDCSSGRPRILIVDDEERVRIALVRWFEMRGFDTDLAKDRVEAVERCTDNDYHTVTMDLEMPRMGGVEAVGLIKEKRPSLPILILTGYSGEAVNPHIAGVAKVLAKPIRLRELEDEVRLVMSRE